MSHAWQIAAEHFRSQATQLTEFRGRRVLRQRVADVTLLRLAIRRSRSFLRMRSWLTSQAPVISAAAPSDTHATSSSAFSRVPCSVAIDDGSRIAIDNRNCGIHQQDCEGYAVRVAAPGPYCIGQQADSGAEDQPSFGTRGRGDRVRGNEKCAENRRAAEKVDAR